MSTPHISAEEACNVLNEYSANAELNAHPENYLLLAETFNDAGAISICRLYLAYLKNESPHRLCNLARIAAADATRNFYYDLKKITTSKLNIVHV